MCSEFLHDSLHSASVGAHTQPSAKAIGNPCVGRHGIANLIDCPIPIAEIPRLSDITEVKSPAKEMAECRPEVAVPDYGGIYPWTKKYEGDNQDEDGNYPDVLSCSMLELCVDHHGDYAGTKLNSSRWETSICVENMTES